MRYVRFLLVVLLPYACGMASAQTQNMDLFCNAGLRPDGYINLAAMPAAPNFPTAAMSATASSAPYTVTLPVTGIAGLSVQITIPALTPLSAGPLYTVVNGAIVLNGIAAANGEIFSLAFSSPVAGLGLVANSVGRQSDFTLQTDAPGATPSNFSNSADTLTIAPKYYSIPLQQVDLQNGFSTAYVLFGGTAGFGAASLSNLRVQSTVAPAPVNLPKEGLQQWLVSESVQSPFIGQASSWPDQSGNEHSATQSNLNNQPTPIQGDGNACRQAFAFTGGQYFNIRMPINSWQQMTIFMVAKSWGDPPAGSAGNAAIFWNENAMWGNTFVTPGQTTAVFRFGTTQVANQPVFSRPVNVGEDFTVTRAEHDGTTDSLYVDGLLVVQQATKLPTLSGMTGTGYIGRGLDGTYFKGEISEILIYNRVLTPSEAAIVESYLRNKFGTR